MIADRLKLSAEEALEFIQKMKVNILGKVSYKTHDMFTINENGQVL